MQKIIYPLHALRRLQKRGISKTQVKKALAEPEITLPTQNPRRARIKKKFGNRYLDVIFKKRRNYIIIVTAAWGKERRRKEK